MQQKKKRINRMKYEPINRFYKIKGRITGNKKKKKKYFKDVVNTSENFLIM